MALFFEERKLCVPFRGLKYVIKFTLMGKFDTIGIVDESYIDGHLQSFIFMSLFLKFLLKLTLKNPVDNFK